MSRIVVTLSVAAVLAGVCLLLPSAITVVAQEPKAEPPTPSKSNPSKDITSNAVSLSVRVDSGRDSTALQLTWSGQDAESLLVVSVAPVEWDMLQHEVMFGETRLAGIVYVGRVGAQGETSVLLPHEPDSESLGPVRCRVRVFLTRSIKVEFVKEESHVKSEGRVVRQKEFRPADAAPELQFFDAAAKGARFFAVAEDEFLRPVIPCDDEQAFLQVSVSLGGRDSP